MERMKANRGLLEWVDSIIFAIVILALVFTFGVRVVQVDGSSMNPGLVDGERLLLSSLPYEPEYGDVVVIKNPSKPIISASMFSYAVYKAYCLIRIFNIPFIPLYFISVFAF